MYFCPQENHRARGRALHRTEHRQVAGRIRGKSASLSFTHTLVYINNGARGAN